jgi:hypothetical protein
VTLSYILRTLQSLSATHCEQDKSDATAQSLTAAPAANNLPCVCQCTLVAKAARYAIVSLLFVENEAVKFHRHRCKAYFTQLGTLLDEQFESIQSFNFAEVSNVAPKGPFRIADDCSKYEFTEYHECGVGWTHQLCASIVDSIEQISTALYSIPSDGVVLPLLFRQADEEEQGKVWTPELFIGMPC